MRSICSAAAVRRAEAGAGVPEPVLMQRAATGLAGICRDLLAERRTGVRGARVLALVGTGNNGGDALWALSFLAARGAATTVIGDPDRMHAHGARAARRAGARVLAWTDPGVGTAITGADLVLDGILGIGGSGGLREPAAGVVRLVAEAGVPVVAVDAPSGVDPDTGQVAGPAVHADVTACFGVLKPALVVAPARALAGSVAVLDIGLRSRDLEIDGRVLSLPDLAVPAPDGAAHKYTRGVVGITAGSRAYPGAGLLAVGGARRSGAGMVSYTPGPVPSSSAGPQGQVVPAVHRAPGRPDLDPVAAMVVASHPDVVLDYSGSVDARCLGPGLGEVRDIADIVLQALHEPAPLVLDASALALFARAEAVAALVERAGSGRITVLTPHAGEFTRMGFDDSGGPFVAAHRAAERTGAVIVLKGPGTVIAAPGARFVDTFGDAALATAGSGDVLAGLVAGMLASAARAAGPASDTGSALTSADAALVAARAVGLHGLAGRLAAADGGPVTATDVRDHLSAAHATATRARALDQG